MRPLIAQVIKIMVAQFVNFKITPKLCEHNYNYSRPCQLYVCDLRHVSRIMFSTDKLGSHDPSAMTSELETNKNIIIELIVSTEKAKQGSSG